MDNWEFVILKQVEDQAVFQNPPFRLGRNPLDGLVTQVRNRGEVSHGSRAAAQEESQKDRDGGKGNSSRRIPEFLHGLVPLSVLGRSISAFFESYVPA